MIFNDLSEFKSAKLNPTVCIIGSGPAGISLALQLEKNNVSCVIIEAGGYEFSAEVQDAYRGKVIGDSYFNLHEARLRYLGGSSGHWAGWCRPLDEIDFEARAGIKNSGWPIQKKVLDPYVAETNKILNVPDIPPDKPIDDDLREVFFGLEQPVRFGKKYRQHINDSTQINLVLNSPLSDIVPSGQKISHVNIHTKNGVLPVSASYFCLCTGGIENSRLLLWSNQLHQNGVVPNAQTLGKYWMEHPTFEVGEALAFSFTKSRAPSGMRFFAPTAAFLRKHAVGNFGMRFIIDRESLSQALLNDGMCIAPKLFSKFSKQLSCKAELRLAWEETPFSENRIELDSEKDATGMPRVKLFWKKQGIERTTVETAVQVFGAYLAKANLGRVKVISWLANKLDYPIKDERAGYHHMGGTRMASDAENGVVDSNCKVFDVDNLFIGGSSVFHTSGHANPTYTIVQLALRLGDHIAELVRKPN